MLAKKSLGQNFLMHRQTAERIVGAALLPENAKVLEIGPGTGMLTRELLNAGMRVIAVESDYALIPKLESTFGNEIEEGTLTLERADIRTFDTTSIKGAYHLVANIPYYITGEIIRQFLTAPNQPASMTLLVQKEVAIRIAREKKESLLSLSVKVYGVPSYCFTVPRGAFKPAPNVDSAVLRIGNISRTGFSDATEEEHFFEVIRAGFAHKRKRLAKNLEEKFSKEMVASAFGVAVLDANVRAEDLSLETWKVLTRELKSS
jgi:16S rRNA (adenine1518-N6/adenine1519-N6)-dimethyltransferase